MTENERTDPNAPGGRTQERLTPLDVQQKEFRVSFRGYNEREVDEFLDRVTVELQRREEEILRLRSEHASIDPSTLDLDAESRRIVREARDRAEAILREAEVRAAAIPTGGDTRAVVAPYLNREREFLQQLGSLVQDHAQTIRTMVEEARRRTEARAPAVTDAPPPLAPEAADGEDRAELPSPPAVADASKVDATANVVVVQAEDDEEEDGRVRATVDRGSQDRPPDEGRSLRELFWGED